MLIALSLLSTRSGQAQDDPNDRFIRSLLERGLVQTAENEALRRLAEPTILPVDRVRWSLRLAESYMQHAGLASGADRLELASRAGQTLTDLRAVTPPLPRQAEIQTVQAILAADHAQLLAWEWRYGDDSEAARESAISRLQSALDTIKTARTRLQSAAPRAGGVDDAEELDTADLRKLERDLDHELAHTLVSLSETLPPSAARDQSLAAADQRLQPLAAGWTGDTRTWDARLARARVARLQGDFDLAASQRRGAMEEQLAGWLADRFVAEEVRALIDSGRLVVALETLLQASREQRGLNGELQYLQVQALLAAARLADQKADSATAADLRGQSEAIASAMPGVWGSAARLRHSRELEVGRYGPQVAERVHAARSFYQAGDSTQALEQFRQAAELAVQTGRLAAADELDYTRASLHIAQEQYARAAEVLDQLLTRSPAGKNSQDADLLRAYATGRLAQDGNEPALAQRYVTLLTQHRERYPHTTSAAEATWMQAAFEESRQQATQALSLYLSLATDAERGPAAQVRTATLYRDILTSLRQQGQDLTAWEDRAVEDLAAFVRGYPVAPGDLKPEQAEVTLELVKIVLAHREHLYSEAAKLLAPVMLAVEFQRRLAEPSQSPPPDSWSAIGRTASQLMIVALAGQGRLGQAQAQFRQLALTAPDELVSLLQGLSRLTGEIPPEHRTGLAELQLDAARELQLRREQLSAPQQQLLDAAVADAYVATGNPVNAVVFYDKLIEQSPQDRRHLRNAAQLHQQIGDAAHLKTARTYWQRLEALSTKGSPEWFDARLHVAECMLKLGDAPQARKLIQLTRLVYPELGGPALKARFDAVESQAAQVSATK